MVACEGEPNAQVAPDQSLVPGQWPYGYPGAGAVSSSSVNVPGQFSYVVNAVHPTKADNVIAARADPQVAAAAGQSYWPGYLPGYGSTGYYGNYGNFGYNGLYGFRGGFPGYGFGRFGAAAGYPYYG